MNDYKIDNVTPDVISSLAQEIEPTDNQEGTNSRNKTVISNSEITTEVFTFQSSFEIEKIITLPKFVVDEDSVNNFDVSANPSPQENITPQQLIISDLNQDNRIENNQESQPTRLVIEERNGKQKQFDLTANSSDNNSSESQVSQSTPLITEEPLRVVEVIADKQEYNEQRQVITAQGNVFDAI